MFQEIIKGKRPYMRCITRVHPAWLAALAPALTVISEPLDNPSPRFNEKTGFKHVFYEMTYCDQRDGMLCKSYICTKMGSPYLDNSIP